MKFILVLIFFSIVLPAAVPFLMIWKVIDLVRKTAPSKEKAEKKNVSQNKSSGKKKKGDRKFIPEEMLDEFSKRYGPGKKHGKDEERKKAERRKKVRAHKDKVKKEKIANYYREDRSDKKPETTSDEALKDDGESAGAYSELYEDPRRAIIYAEIFGEPLSRRKGR